MTGLLITGLAAAYAGRFLVVSRPVAAPDAIVSLASHEWERLPLAAELAQQHPAAVVLLTLPQVPSIHNCHECGRRVDRLVAAGVAADRIRIVPLSGGGTYGEAEACRRFASQVSVKRLLIVTSPYHTRRALAVFRSVFSGIATEVGIAPASSYSAAQPRRWWLSAYDLWYVSYEWAAMPYYMLRYGVTPLVR